MAKNNNTLLYTGLAAVLGFLFLKKKNKNVSGISGLQEVTQKDIEEYRKKTRNIPEKINDRYAVIIKIHYPEGKILASQFWTKEMIQKKYSYTNDNYPCEFIEYV